MLFYFLHVWMCHERRKRLTTSIRQLDTTVACVKCILRTVITYVQAAEKPDSITNIREIVIFFYICRPLRTDIAKIIKKNVIK